MNGLAKQNSSERSFCLQQRAIVHPFVSKEALTPTDAESRFASIFETYHKRIYNYIAYRVNCHFTAEDLTSQVFERTLTKIGTYSENKSPFEVWLFAIARNTVNDHYRSLKSSRLFSLTGLKELVSGKKSPESLIIEGEFNDQLQQALQSLNARERNMIALKFGAELKHTQISELLGISENNVGIILYRTMIKLRKQLGSVKSE
jgi:RNA polymerase sigma-70 factor (ECF subfamily)